MRTGDKLLYSGVAVSLLLTAMIFIAPFSVANPFAQMALAASGSGSGSSNRVQFDITDDPGRWFRNVQGDITASGTESLAVGTPAYELTLTADQTRCTQLQA